MVKKRLDDFFEMKEKRLLEKDDLIADLHLHSKYSGATSKSMDLKSIAQAAKIKGLNLIGTGDCLHAKWLSELKTTLKPSDGEFYEYNGILFVVSGEVNTIFSDEGKLHKIHNLIIVPSLEKADEMSKKLAKYGDLLSDGRPTLYMSAAELVEEATSIDNDIEIIPAHIWTPWFSLFGANSGFDSVEECFKDKSSKIHSLETGLSSDPEMNWMISRLDRFNLLSNSDAHSHHLWRIGREANVLRVMQPTFKMLIKALRTGEGIKLTLEVPPEFGKYHWSGHRNCKVALSPEEAMKASNICPKCGKKLTIGVEQRVYMLADRKKGFIPPNKPPFVKVLPLQEILKFILGSNSYTSKNVMRIYDSLIERYGNEYEVLLNAPINEIKSFNKELALIIEQLRQNKVKIKPGYDGVYGELEFNISN